MARTLFLVALPRAPLRMVLTALNPATQVVYDVGGVQYVRSPIGISVWRRVVRSIRDNMPPSEAPSTKWSIWCVTAKSRLQVARLFRWLGRYRITEPDRVLGPWDFATFKLLAPTRTDDNGKSLADLFTGGGVPWVIMGDDVAEVQDEKYNPSDSDIANDTPEVAA